MRTTVEDGIEVFDVDKIGAILLETCVIFHNINIMVL